MQPHQIRVVHEKEELVDKWNKLGIFLGTEVFINIPRDERFRLIKQHGFMKAYIDILNERIEAFIP